MTWNCHFSEQFLMVKSKVKILHLNFCKEKMFQLWPETGQNGFYVKSPCWDHPFTWQPGNISKRNGEVVHFVEGLWTSYCVKLVDTRSLNSILGFLGGLVVKNPPAMQEPQEMQVPSLGREDPLEEGMATHSSILAWRISMDRGARWATVHWVTNS